MKYPTPVLFAAVASILSAGPAYADVGDQLAMLMPNDGAVSDKFGSSVAISGATVVVGAPYDGDNGRYSGSAYLFDISDPKKPVQLAKLLPKDGASGDQFGYSVAISGDTVIIGANKDDGKAKDAGSGYLFDISDRTKPTQRYKLVDRRGAKGDSFARSVAICGPTVIVGANRNDLSGNDSGAAYLFIAPTGRQRAKLYGKDGARGDQFGLSVGISGSIVIIGAAFDDDKGDQSGSAYLWRVSNPRNPMQIAKFVAKDGAARDRFGVAVAISVAPGKKVAIVGADADDDNGHDSGSAYLFDTTTFRQIGKLLADDGGALERFGMFVGISGTTAIVGSKVGPYLFDITDPAKPKQVARLVSEKLDSTHRFTSVAINGTIAIVGAPYAGDNGRDSGAAYLFEASRAPKVPAKP